MHMKRVRAKRSAAEKALLLGLLIYGVSTPCYADEPLAKIEGEMSQDFRELLQNVLGEVEESPRSLAQAQRRAEKALEQAYSVARSRGYYKAKIDVRLESVPLDEEVSTQKAPRPILDIELGPQFSFGKITVNYSGNSPDKITEVDKVINLSTGQTALAPSVVAAELRAVNYLKANGYPETQILDRRVVVDHDTQNMNVTFNFSVGNKTRFGAIKQTGSAYIVKSWPKLVAPFEEGDIFSDREMNRLTSRIIGTNVFDSATAILADEKIPNGDGTVTRNVLLNVEQGHKNTVSGEIGYSTTDGSGVDLTYERRNFVGYAQTLTLSTSLKTNQIRFGADYNIPYLFREDRALDLSAEVAREDTEAFKGERVGGTVLMTQKVSSRFKLGLGIGLEASRFEENGQDVTAYLIDGLGTATYDSRNSILNPVKGIFAEASVIPTYNFGNQKGLFTTVEAGASSYKRISDSFVVAGRAKVGTLFGADQPAVPLNRRFYGGGGGSVRGYGYQSISPVNADGDEIGGRSITELSAELRYRGDSPFGAVAFVDAGSVARNDLPNLQDIRYGAGIGLRYFTSFAPLRADIAIPLNKREGDADFQIYLSIGQAF